MDFWCQLQPPEPSKSLFLKKNKVFFFNNLSKLASIFDAIWVPNCFHFPSQIHQNPIKIKSQEPFKKWLILTSMFDRFALRFGSQVGTMLPTTTTPRRPQDAPRRAQDALRNFQDAPKTPRWLQEAPGRLQDRPRSPPRPLKTAPGSAQEPPEVLINWRGGTKAQPSTIII